MLARLQQAITLSLLGLAALWAAVFWHRGQPWWAALGALLIVFGYALFLGLEFFLLWCVHGDDPAPRPTAAQLARAWWGEITTAPRVMCWQQPFRSQAQPDFLPADSGRRGLVLVHGFVCNRGFWNRWMPRLRQQGIPHVALTLEPVFGSISDYVPSIERAVRRVQEATGLAPVLVAHSMGGLALRAWLAEYDGAARVHRVVTVASPHHGTWPARFATVRNGREMALASTWLRALEARESAQSFARFTCFYSHCDNIVFPASTASLAGAENRHLSATAHVHLADHPAVFREVVAWASGVSPSGSSASTLAR